MIRVELARSEAPTLPLDVMGADLQGGLGYMIERVLRSKLRRRGLVNRACCMLTMVEVDANDPAFGDPTKFVGPVYTAEEAAVRARERGWAVKEDKGRGWRRVVPSPEPKSIIERHEILALLEAGTHRHQRRRRRHPGGAQQQRRPRRRRRRHRQGPRLGVMALALGAPELIILTGVDRVQIGYGTPQARPLNIVTVAEAREYNGARPLSARQHGPQDGSRLPLRRARRQAGR